MKSKIMNNLRLRIEFIFIYILYIILSILPFFVVSNLGSVIFKLIGPKTKIQKIVHKNLIQIFPKAKSSFLKKEYKENWSKVGKTFFELLILTKIMNIKNKIIIEGKENIINIIKKKR